MMAVTVFGVYPADAKSAATATAEDLVQSIVVPIHIRTPLGQNLCHGYVAEVRGDVAYIVTAKHCVAELSPTACFHARRGYQTRTGSRSAASFP
jgi:hypothetical protein